MKETKMKRISTNQKEMQKIIVGTASLLTHSNSQVIALWGSIISLGPSAGHHSHPELAPWLASGPHLMLLAQSKIRATGGQGDQLLFLHPLTVFMWKPKIKCLVKFNRAEGF